MNKTTIVTILGALGALFTSGALMISGKMDPATGLPIVYSSVATLLAAFHINVAVNAHVDEHHPDQSPPGSSNKGSANFGLLIIVCSAFLLAAGCSSIPTTHVMADISHRNVVGKMWLDYIKTGRAPSGQALSPLFMSQAQDTYDAWGKDNLEEAISAGLLPSTATSTASLEGLN